MSSTTGIVNGGAFLSGTNMGLDILSGITNVAGSFKKQMETAAAKDISMEFQIADIINQSKNQASEMKIKAMGYENNEANIRRQLKEEIRLFDEKASAAAGAIQNRYVSSGVKAEGSALAAMEAAENSVALQRLARQNAADSEAMEREAMASQLKLSAGNTIKELEYSVKRIRLGVEMASVGNKELADFILEGISGVSGKIGSKYLSDYEKELKDAKNKSKKDLETQKEIEKIFQSYPQYTV